VNHLMHVAEFSKTLRAFLNTLMKMLLLHSAVGY